jgi:hypothetical protein
MADETRAPSAAGFAARRTGVASCWMCGIHLQQAQMVPDGGDACGDVRWYCKDTGACTERWTSARRQARAAEAATGRGAAASPRGRSALTPGS